MRSFPGLLILGALICVSNLAYAQIETTGDLIPLSEKQYLEGKITHQERLENFTKNRLKWTERDKINFLLQSINRSSMIFVRNGSEYTGNQAMRWLRWKSMHKKFRKNPIRTAEAFIQKVATKSNTSGFNYQLINSEKERVNLGDILNNELEALEDFLEKVTLERASEEEALVVEKVVEEQLQNIVLVPAPTPAA